MMGGYLSGWHRGRRRTVEEARRLDVLAWKREGLLRPGVSWTTQWRNCEGEPVASIGCACVGYSGAVELSYRWTPPGGDAGEDLRYSIKVEWTNCNYGRARPWFRCPNLSCGRRCRFLHEAERYYVCRMCARLTYRTRQQSRSLFGEAYDLEERTDTLYDRLARARSPRRKAQIEARIDRLEERKRVSLLRILAK